MNEKLEIEFKKIDVLDKKANIIHKKILILLGALTGAGAIMFKDFDSVFITASIILFLLFSSGVYVNYRRLNNLYNEIEKIENKIKGLENGN